MNFKRLVYIVAILLVLVVGVNYISETYSKYNTSENSSAGSQVAKWAIALKNGNTELDKQFNLLFESETTNNGNAAKDRIAPGTSGKAKLVLDLTDTEVAIDYNIAVDTTTLENKIGTSNITLEVVDDDGNNISLGEDTYIPLVNNEKFTKDNGVFGINFYLTWDNSGEEDASDTKIATSIDTLVLPLSVKVKQHVE